MSGLRIDMDALPVGMQEQARRKLAAQMRAREAMELGEKREQERKAKYNSVAEFRRISGVDVRFASKKEARRYDILLLRMLSGDIADLRMQVNFTLQEGFTTCEGVKIKPIRYVADFTYRKNGKLIIEDVKSPATKTALYRLKKKMMLEKGYEITEVE